jgi:hypothetical protein
LPQRPVKYGIARRVRKVGEHNGVFVGELGRAVEIEVTTE